MNLKQHFEDLKVAKRDISEHMEYLKDCVRPCEDVVVELGVQTGVSTTAFLMGKPKKHIAVDILEDKNFYDVMTMAKAEGLDIEYWVKDDLTIEIPECDILFIDSYHSYKQLKQELALHGNKAHCLIILHDTADTCCGNSGQDSTSPGLNQAINEWLAENKNWKIKKVVEFNNGLTTLEKI